MNKKKVMSPPGACAFLILGPRLHFWSLLLRNPCFRSDRQGRTLRQKRKGTSLYTESVKTGSLGGERLNKTLYVMASNKEGDIQPAARNKLGSCDERLLWMEKAKVLIRSL